MAYDDNTVEMTDTEMQSLLSYDDKTVELTDTEMQSLFDSYMLVTGFEICWELHNGNILVNCKYGGGPVELWEFEGSRKNCMLYVLNEYNEHLKNCID